MTCPCDCAQSAADELQTVEGTLDAVLLDGTTNATGLASEINAASSHISTTPFPSATLNALAGSQVSLMSCMTRPPSAYSQSISYLVHAVPAGQCFSSRDVLSSVTSVQIQAWPCV